jgi:hypothetical protein
MGTTEQELGAPTATRRAGIAFRASFEGRSGLEILAATRALGWAPTSNGKLFIDSVSQASTESLEEAVGHARRSVEMNYERAPEIVVIRLYGANVVQVGRLGVTIDLNELPRQLSNVPFELASFSNLHRLAWGRQTDPDYYRPPSFADGHDSLGWAAAFRGKGHDRLVSRRWLETGPWKLWRGPEDVSVVQFHALDADAKTALEQAKPGHRLIGLGSESGFLQSGFVYTMDLKGLYEPATRTMRVIIHGREVSSREMLEWAAARISRRDPKFPFETVAFVFMVPHEARAHLSRLWKYEHQCWAIVDGEERRLDLDYTPPDLTPDWARG